MNFYDLFKDIMKSQTELALATSIGNIPNVRIVSFYYNEQSKILFFSTFKDNEKVEEIELNNIVSIITIPKNGIQHVRMKGGIAQKSLLSIYDVKEQFTRKIPDYAEIIDEVGSSLIVYEVHFEKALVFLNRKSFKEIVL